MCDMTHMHMWHVMNKWVSHIWLSHATLDWVMSHIGLSHGTLMDESFHTHERDWGRSRARGEDIMSPGTESCHLGLSRVTYDWVMSHMTESCHIWLSHVTYDWVLSHMTELWWTSQVTLVNQTGGDREREGKGSHRSRSQSPDHHLLRLSTHSCRTYKRVMPHVRMSCVIYGSRNIIAIAYNHHIIVYCVWVHIHVVHMKESCRAYKWVVSHMNVSCRTYDCIMSHI